MSRTDKYASFIAPGNFSHISDSLRDFQAQTVDHPSVKHALVERDMNALANMDGLHIGIAMGSASMI
ncbi:hypothetical protein ACVITL_006575 [Rhizobium pisi]|jgi:hypothetical protein